MTQQTPNTQSQQQPAKRLWQRTAFDDLPRYWRDEIKSLRAENAKYRRERNDLRAELAEAQQRIAALMLDVADLRDGMELSAKGQTGE